jgi:hypothetical protein
MIDFWADELPGGTTLKVPVVVINDLDTDWQGPLELSHYDRGKTIVQKIPHASVPALGREVFAFEIHVPADPGWYRLAAKLRDAAGEDVYSLRDFTVPGK